MTKTQRPQIRPCVVLFVEILGLENYLTTMEPDEYAELIQTIFNQLDETIEIYDGHINQHKENIIMALFGVPVAHEDDPERAIRSALLMAKRIEDLKANSNISVQLRIGLNLGRVCAGEIGATGKFSFTVMGDVVNTAARIMENGTAGQILITEDIYSNTRTVFEFSNPFKLTIKDTGKDLTVYNVLRMRSGLIKRRGIEGLQSPLIGRDQEYKLLRETIEQIVHKRKGSIVLINGEAGVGKSRLIEEVFTYSLRLSLEEAKIVNWFTGRCSPYKEQVYSPIVEIIKQICNIESTDSEDRLINKLQTAVKKIMNGKADEAYPYLAQLFNIKLESNQEVMVKYLRPKDLKLQTQISASLFLKNYAASVPTVYCIDDLHFADETTLELLNFFLQTPPELPGLIILISRVDKDKPYWSLQENLKKELDLIEINLARLDPNATREITRNLLKIPNLAESLIDEIVSRSEGNPFFLEEIIKLLISRGILYRQGNQWFARSVKTDISIPYTIEGIIRSRLDTLSDDLREILSEMAVLGRNFSLRLLKKFTSRWEEFDRLIVQLRENGFISSNNDEDYSFNHGLLRDVIYSSIPKNILKELHLKVAETIETLYKDRLNEFNEVLFEHFSKTDNFEKAIDYAFKAGENAQTKYANTAAIFYYLWIIDELNRQGGNHSLKRIALENLGKVYSIIGQNDDALMVYNQALSLSEEPKQRAKIYAAIAHTYERISDYEKATDYYQNALSLLSEPDVALQLETMIGLAWVKYLKGEFSSSQEVLENGLKLTLDRSGIDMRKVQARIYNILGSIHARIGREEESFDYY
ncbi:MAG: adenylate/guanylate cyclase domain-containing protein, partial [candidate division WOR-3 bacterium]